jgi:hypothetical protein
MELSIYFEAESAKGEAIDSSRSRSIVRGVSDSLLVGALSDTHRLLDQHDDEDSLDVSALRARVEGLDRASAAIELRLAQRDDIVRLARLAMEVREAAAELRRRAGSIEHSVRRTLAGRAR